MLDVESFQMPLYATVGISAAAKLLRLHLHKSAVASLSWFFFPAESVKRNRYFHTLPCGGHTA